MSSQNVVALATKILAQAKFYEELNPKGSQGSRTSEAVVAHDELFNLVDVLRNELRSPTDVVVRTEEHHIHLFALRALNQYKVAAQVPQNGSISYEELAAKCGLEQSLLERIVRYAISAHIFTERKKGFVEHNAASQVLVDFPGAKEAVDVVAGTLWPSASRAVDAMVKWPAAEEPTETGFNLAFDTPNGFFQYVGSDKARMMNFGQAMRFTTTPEGGMDPTPILKTPPIQDILHREGATLVDVGGGMGILSKLLLAHSSTLHCTVQDMAKLVARLSVPPELEGKLVFQAHDIFDEQPIKGADVYFFSNMLHHWSDKYAERILKALIPALKPNAKILALDHVIPSHGDPNITRERAIRAYDLGMLTFLNGKERDEEGFKQLFSRASPKFKFVGVYSAPESESSLVEFIWT